MIERVSMTLLGWGTCDGNHRTARCHGERGGVLVWQEGRSNLRRWNGCPTHHGTHSNISLFRTDVKRHPMNHLIRTCFTLSKLWKFETHGMCHCVTAMWPGVHQVFKQYTKLSSRPRTVALRDYYQGYLAQLMISSLPSECEKKNVFFCFSASFSKVGLLQVQHLVVANPSFWVALIQQSTASFLMIISVL